MSNRLQTIEGILGHDGRLSGFIEDFEFRPSQVKMAQLIMQALQEKSHAIIEAGTGTGKTMGYLVPVMLSGKKTVISTGTKNLQEQIFFQDIPLITKLAGLHVDALLMKGRKNYLCLHRYNQYFIQPSLLHSNEKETLARLEQWLQNTESGDRAELAWLTDDDPLWDSISSTSEQCLGSECPHIKDCFLNTLRKNAARADIIIVNHHLFFADLMVKTEGFGEIIPRFQAVIFDEAHNIEEIAVNYFGESVSNGQLLEFIKDVEKETKIKRSSGEISSNLNIIRDGSEKISRIFALSEDRGKLNEEEIKNIHEGPSRDIRTALDLIGRVSGQVISTRADELILSLEKIFTYNSPEWLKWYEKKKRGITFHSSLLDISRTMREQLHEVIKTIIFTSATLSTNGNFDYIKKRLGIPEGALEGIYPSHFNFKEQSILYIPLDMPSPSAADFALKAADRMLEILEITSGRALILFTGYNNMNIAYQRIKGALPYKVLKQGDSPKSALLEEFRSDINSVLLATGSFWQGVDVPGEALSCLIIDKLPFDSPGDPLVSARIESMKRREENPFMDYQLPSAVISLKQGLGRLIRKKSDQGLLSILDKRIIINRYGSIFLKSLPEIPITHELNDVRGFFGRQPVASPEEPVKDKTERYRCAKPLRRE
jgi:ATP-dependent DNA helicase DinG